MTLSFRSLLWKKLKKTCTDDVYIHLPAPCLYQFGLYSPTQVKVCRCGVECFWCHWISYSPLMTIHLCKFHWVEIKHRQDNVLIHWFYFLLGILCDSISFYSVLRKVLFLTMLGSSARTCGFLFLFTGWKDLSRRMTFSHWGSSHRGSCSQEVKSRQDLPKSFWSSDFSAFCIPCQVTVRFCKVIDWDRQPDQKTWFCSLRLLCVLLF